MRLRPAIGGAACLLVAAAPARAQGLVATLEVSTPTTTQRASSLTPPTRSPAGPVVVVSADQPLTVQWQVRDRGPEPVAEVLAHCFVVASPAPTPESTRARPVVETALTMDFNATNVASGTFSVRVPAAGVYAVEIVAQGSGSDASTPARAALAVRVR